MRPCRSLRGWVDLRVWLIFLGAVGPVQPVAAQAPSVPASPGWAGVVTHVVDGDTLYVRPLSGGAARSVRVLGMDAPEICQDGGTAARDALQTRVFQRRVQVEGRGTDDYGRELGVIYLGQEDVGTRKPA